MKLYTIVIIRWLDEEFYGVETLATTRDFEKAQKLMWDYVDRCLAQDGYRHTGGHSRSYEYADMAFIERQIGGREDWLNIYILQNRSV